ncbi:hypothetical protein HOI26_02330 [Candidatus Woesearchaeota archaeon]|nr:hypothetical protein [Candidatus Woesearchaeota archaeon]MBT5739915.1 hypothetical protein [Candidatus Woesearchaeota archaeon]
MAKKKKTKSSRKVVAKREICGLHCPSWTTWLFVLLGAWFVLSAFDVPTFGGFWSWLILILGVCTVVCALNPAHRKTSCPFAGVPIWAGVLTIVIGAWFVLGDAGVITTFGISLLYLAFFIGTIVLLKIKK